MIIASDPVDGLEVSREDLLKAVRIVSRLVEKRNKAVSLRFEDGWLFIEAGHGHAVAKAHAQGYWPLTIVVGVSWVRRLAKNMPPGTRFVCELRTDDCTQIDTQSGAR